MTARILVGDCRAMMATLPDASVDAVVCDPPYELGFMGKAWDASGIAYDVEVWRQAFRVLKPGGHLLAFSGSRTYHRMACAIEDAGFEIRDQIMWVYGSGFPKSLDVSKAIDRAAGAEREVIGFDAAKALQQTAKVGTQAYEDFAGSTGNITAPATDDARQWSGWGTALKPAHEPICMARKPLIGTVAANVLAHGTGAINVDGCRVDGAKTRAPVGHYERPSIGTVGHSGFRDGRNDHLGRWPANFILSHTPDCDEDGCVPECPCADIDAQSGVSRDGVAVRRNLSEDSVMWFGTRQAQRGDDVGYGGYGGASRFFYTAKASREDREEGCDEHELVRRTDGREAENHTPRLRTTERRNHHPTVKPTELMRYLCRLVTPPGGTVLDPFTGSGSTGRGAVLEGFDFIGCELSPEYAELARARIRGVAMPLFPVEVE